MADYTSTTLRQVYVTGLQNAHAVEQQALALIDRQLDRLQHYPNLAERLRLHRRETEDQMSRLREILGGFNETPSALKDAALGMVGNLAALSHVPAPDEVLKNSFVSYAFEHFEIASYRSLIALAEAGSFGASLPLLETSLSEERAMASWVEDHLAEITLRYVGLRSEGRTASH